ncbi:XRE family transcriptional regulator [Hymenobacter jeollabukensis]|uniref:XRE family transcriptional regulator n=1 Tax=Hymenobacter jeollabukensis TaxID=2025313 RepID=A0A5R8WUX7_9BACT|nr:XRE family transcriptional regulator [Hymenobacter jeollabukensis]TLM95569.1 XRE family transcriptional regulator [Hymenobacter jeollabukensis]
MTDTPDPRILQIAHKLKHLRLAAGYTSYEAFAFDHDLPRVGYGRHEKGSNLTLKSLLRLLDIHGLTLAEFFADLS